MLLWKTHKEGTCNRCAVEFDQICAWHNQFGVGHNHLTATVRERPVFDIHVVWPVSLLNMGSDINRASVRLCRIGRLCAVPE